MQAQLNGQVDARFARVRDAFAENFTRRGEVGAACAVLHRGALVVDLWGGWADREAQREWQADTLQLVFSATKGVTAACVLWLAEHGEIDLDAPVARYWPEFAAHGKADIRVRWVMSHRAGVPLVDAPLTLAEVLAWDPVVRAIAAQAPLWQPNSAHGYHFRTYGWILGEIVRRVAGCSLGTFFAETFAAPLGLEFWIGLPLAQEARVARLYAPPQPADAQMRELLAQVTAPDTVLGRAMFGPSNLFAYDERWNGRALHAAELPSSNGIGTARSLAQFYAALIGTHGGAPLLAAETLADATRVQSDGTDRVLTLPTRFGSGFMLPPILAPSAGAQAFGHPGAGGSLGLADPERGLAFAYVMNQMGGAVAGDQRAATLLQAVYESL
jgi:CubicO group peptidase (beta-lactamase class C family)